MKSLSEQDHYEVLESRRDATPDQIERSYRMALATYANDSLAGYSMFSDGDAEAIRERIETAYRVLADPESRSAYDASLRVPEAFPEAAVEALRYVEHAEPQSRLALPPLDEDPIDDLEPYEDDEGDFDGARLRRYRLRCEMELDDIASITKINPGYLRAIEEERFADLPPRVYVRGFVSAFASTVGLDPKTVATTYMRLYDQGRQDARKSRFFDGR